MCLSPCLNPDESRSILHDLPFDFSLKNRDPGAAPQASPAPSSAHGPSRAERPHRNRRAMPPARGGRSRAGPPARSPRVVAGILATCRDPRPGHAQHGRVPSTAVTRLALWNAGQGCASTEPLTPLLASRPAELSPAPAPAPRSPFRFRSSPDL